MRPVVTKNVSTRARRLEKKDPDGLHHGIHAWAASLASD